MRRAGIFGDAFSSPVTNFTKADNLKNRKPARMAYYSMCVPCTSSSAPLAQAQEKYEKCKFFF